VDKDLTAALLATALAADALVILTDVAAVEDGYGNPPGPADRPDDGPRPAGPLVPGRLHAAEGRGRLPFRRGDRRDGRHRPARRRGGAARRDRGHGRHAMTRGIVRDGLAAGRQARDGRGKTTVRSG
jgi:hypothetical protein